MREWNGVIESRYCFFQHDLSKLVQCSRLRGLLRTCESRTVNVLCHGLGVFGGVFRLNYPSNDHALLSTP